MPTVLTRSLVLGALVVVLPFWTASPAHSTPSTGRVALAEDVSGIRAWNGIAVLSVSETAGGPHRLAVVRDSHTLEFLPVPARTVPFDADIGPDAQGAPVIVYSRCRHEPDTRGRGRRDCDLYRYDLARETERRISSTDSDAASEFNPSIWRDNVAWVRTGDEGAGDRPVVYARSLGSGAARSRRIPGLPVCRRSDVAGSACGATRGSVDEVELYGRWVAVNVTYTYPDISGICGQREVRLTTIDGGPVRQVANTLCGLSGQTHVGVSFDRGRLWWARSCPGDDGGCTDTGGAWRYGLRSRRYERSSIGDGGGTSYPDLVGFSAAGNGMAYFTEKGYGQCPPGRAVSASCGEVLRAYSFDFMRARAPR